MCSRAGPQWDTVVFGCLYAAKRKTKTISNMYAKLRCGHPAAQAVLTSSHVLA